MSVDLSLRAGRVGARLARQVEVGLAQVELSLSQYRTLMFLDEGSAAASALADHLAVSRPSVTAVVDGLVGGAWSSASMTTRATGAGSITASRTRVAGCSAQADDAVEARLREIAGHLPSEGAG